MSNEWWQSLCLIQLELHREWLDKVPKIVLIQWCRVSVYISFAPPEIKKEKEMTDSYPILNYNQNCA